MTHSRKNRAAPEYVSQIITRES